MPNVINKYDKFKPLYSIFVHPNKILTRKLGISFTVDQSALLFM